MAQSLPTVEKYRYQSKEIRQVVLFIHLLYRYLSFLPFVFLDPLRVISLGVLWICSTSYLPNSQTGVLPLASSYTTRMTRRNYKLQIPRLTLRLPNPTTPHVIISIMFSENLLFMFVSCLGYFFTFVFMCLLRNFMFLHVVYLLILLMKLGF